LESRFQFPKTRIKQVFIKTRARVYPVDMWITHKNEKLIFLKNGLEKSKIKKSGHANA
jgi:hypothetical protein